jgi:hypothetical protein
MQHGLYRFEHRLAGFKTFFTPFGKMACPAPRLALGKGLPDL